MLFAGNTWNEIQPWPHELTAGRGSARNDNDNDNDSDNNNNNDNDNDCLKG